VEGLIIVDTPDALLVATKEHAEEVKDVVDHLRREEREELL
jgi:mannose-1-phosphate guanylyltransferase